MPIKRTRARSTVWFGAGLAFLVLAVGAYLLRGRILEAWWIVQLRSDQEATVRSALDRLAAAQSLRAVPGIVELYARHERDLTNAREGLAEKAIEAASRVGSAGLAALFERVDHGSKERVASFLAEHWDWTLPLLLECVHDDREKVLALASAALRDMEAGADSQLFSALEGPSQRARFAAAWALAPRHSRHRKVRLRLLESLSDSSPLVRKEAVRALQLGNLYSVRCELARFAGPALVEALIDSDPVVRQEAAYSLRDSRHEEAIPILGRALADPDPRVQSAASHALSGLARDLGGNAASRKLIPALLAIFRGQDPEAARLAAKVLTDFGKIVWPALPELLDYWKGQKESEYYFLRVVCELGPAAHNSVEDVVAILARNHHSSRSGAVIALKEMGPMAQSTLPRFMTILKDRSEGSDEWLRTYAQSAIPAICPSGDRVLPELLMCLKDSTERVEARAAAAIAIGGLRIPPGTVLPTLSLIVSDQNEDPKLRSAAAEALGSMGRAARETAPSIEKLLGIQGAEYLQVLKALWRVEPKNIPRVVRVCVRFLKENEETWGYAGELEAIGPAAAPGVPALIKHLQTGRDDALSDSPQEALRAIRKPAVPALAEALRHEDAVVRSQAAEVLGWIGPAAEEALPALTAALLDEDSEVRRDVAKARHQVSVLLDLHRPPEPFPSEPPALVPLLLDAKGTEMKTRQDWSARREELRAEWLASLFGGDLPRDGGPLEPRVLETVELTRVTRERVQYRHEDGVAAEADLLTPWDVPANGSRKLAAVVVFPSTADPGVQRPSGPGASRPELAIGMAFAERGFVVLCPSSSITTERHPDWHPMGHQLIAASRAADFLESLHTVDASRIGCIGHAFGAGVALLAAGFDERFRVAVLDEGCQGFERDVWDTVRFPRGRHELLALTAPRALLLVAGGEAAAGTASWRYVEAALSVYDVLGAQSRFGWTVQDGSSNCTRQTQAVAEEFLERSLRE